MSSPNNTDHPILRYPLRRAYPSPNFGPSTSVSSLGHTSLPSSPSSPSSSSDELEDSNTSTRQVLRPRSESMVILRRFSTDGSSLRPQVRSMLRISKDLMDEMCPLDVEMRCEARITTLLRDEDEETKPKVVPPIKGVLKPPLPPQGVQTAPASPIISKKRRFEEEDEPTLKRRAVSPGFIGLMIPPGSPTKINVKHVRDTSDGLERMKLV